MKINKLLLLAFACAWSLGAAAQWQWIDKDGRKVFSDRAPPLDIPDKSILKQPGGTLGGRTDQKPVLSTVTAEPATTASAPKPPAAGKDKELEEKKAQAEAAEAAKKKAEEEKIAKAKADNCTRARQAKSTLDSGRPMMHTNAQGERVYLDEATRVSESKRIDSVIASDCAR
ncbi:DUF4124 domain-containing protein [Acidovorax carolinensis]|uniref:DUF4124 domain-containing protein n=1 Tax=Acidovorax carolinensis TaxID=553814 RepID=A0A240U2K5_9BURK|nr:DUF4124 domain-containing protein [Acidovorax carolinensis]ART52085.1 DUF4124 domain-containing protein [Acidovorax carolinensis]